MASYRVNRRALLAAGVVVVVFVGCAAPITLLAGAIAVPTYEADPHGVCTLALAINPVSGHLSGDASDASWPVYLFTDDGRRSYVRWPSGFSARFDPGPTLLDETGTAFASDGGRVTINQNIDPSMGTKDRPYLATNFVRGDLSHGDRCYAPKVGFF